MTSNPSILMAQKEDDDEKKPPQGFEKFFKKKDKEEKKTKKEEEKKDDDELSEEEEPEQKEEKKTDDRNALQKLFFDPENNPNPEGWLGLLMAAAVGYYLVTYKAPMEEIVYCLLYTSDAADEP